MLIESTVWSIVRVVVLLFLPTCGIVVTLLLAKHGRKKLAGSIGVLSLLGLLFMIGHCVGNVMLMPYTVITVTGNADTISVRREAVLFDKTIEFNGQSYPALQRDMIINDSDQFVIYEAVSYAMDNLPSSVFELASIANPQAKVIPPGGVFEDEPGFFGRITIDYTGETPPPAIIQKEVPATINNNLEMGFWGQSTRYWLHWTPDFVNVKTR